MSQARIAEVPAGAGVMFSFTGAGAVYVTAWSAAYSTAGAGAACETAGAGATFSFIGAGAVSVTAGSAAYSITGAGA